MIKKIIKKILICGVLVGVFFTGSCQVFGSNTKAITALSNAQTKSNEKKIESPKTDVQTQGGLSTGDILTIFSIIIAFWILYRDLNFNAKSRYLDRISDYMKDIDGVIIGKVINFNEITIIELNEKYLINSYIDALESYINLIKDKSLLQRWILPENEILNNPFKVFNKINKETLAINSVVICLSQYKSFIQSAGVDNLNNNIVNLDVDELLHHSSLLSTALEEYLSLVKRYF